MPGTTVRVPGLLGRFTDGAREIAVDADTVDDAIGELLDRHPELETHLFDQHGSLRTHIRLLVDGRLVDPDEAGETTLDEGSEVVFVQAVSGG